MPNNEKLLLKNHFGVITDTQVISKNQEGLSQLPFEKITSAEIKRESNVFLCVSFIIIGILCFAGVVILKHYLDLRYIRGLHFAMVMLCFVFCFIVAVCINIFFQYRMIIRVKGQYIEPIKVNIFRIKECKLFISEINKHIKSASL